MMFSLVSCFIGSLHEGNVGGQRCSRQLNLARFPYRKALRRRATFPGTY